MNRKGAFFAAVALAGLTCISALGAVNLFPASAAAQDEKLQGSRAGDRIVKKEADEHPTGNFGWTDFLTAVCTKNGTLTKRTISPCPNGGFSVTEQTCKITGYGSWPSCIEEHQCEAEVIVEACPPPQTEGGSEPDPRRPEEGEG